MYVCTVTYTRFKSNAKILKHKKTVARIVIVHTYAPKQPTIAIKEMWHEFCDVCSAR